MDKPKGEIRPNRIPTRKKDETCTFTLELPSTVPVGTLVNGQVGGLRVQVRMGDDVQEQKASGKIEQAASGNHQVRLHVTWLEDGRPSSVTFRSPDGVFKDTQLLMQERVSSGNKTDSSKKIRKPRAAAAAAAAPAAASSQSKVQVHLEEPGEFPIFKKNMMVPFAVVVQGGKPGMRISLHIDGVENNISGNHIGATSKTTGTEDRHVATFTVTPHEDGTPSEVKIVAVKREFEPLVLTPSGASASVGSSVSAGNQPVVAQASVAAVAAVAAPAAAVAMGSRPAAAALAVAAVAPSQASAAVSAAGVDAEPEFAELPDDHPLKKAGARVLTSLPPQKAPPLERSIGFDTREYGSYGEDGEDVDEDVGDVPTVKLDEMPEGMEDLIDGELVEDEPLEVGEADLEVLAEVPEPEALEIEGGDEELAMDDGSDEILMLGEADDEDEYAVHELSFGTQNKARSHGGIAGVALGVSAVQAGPGIPAGPSASVSAAAAADEEDTDVNSELPADMIEADPSEEDDKPKLQVEHDGEIFVMSDVDELKQRVSEGQFDQYSRYSWGGENWHPLDSRKDLKNLWPKPLYYVHLEASRDGKELFNLDGETLTLNMDEIKQGITEGRLKPHMYFVQSNEPEGEMVRLRKLGEYSAFDDLWPEEEVEADQLTSFVKVEGQTFPLEKGDLERWVVEGRVNRNTLSSEDGVHWTTLGNRSELEDLWPIQKSKTAASMEPPEFVDPHGSDLDVDLDNEEDVSDSDSMGDLVVLKGDEEAIARDQKRIASRGAEVSEELKHGGDPDSAMTEEVEKDLPSPAQLAAQMQQLDSPTIAFELGGGQDSQDQESDNDPLPLVVMSGIAASAPRPGPPDQNPTPEVAPVEVELTGKDKELFEQSQRRDWRKGVTSLVLVALALLVIGIGGAGIWWVIDNQEMLTKNAIAFATEVGDRVQPAPVPAPEPETEVAKAAPEPEPEVEELAPAPEPETAAAQSVEPTQCSTWDRNGDGYPELDLATGRMIVRCGNQYFLSDAKCPNGFDSCFFTNLEKM